MHVPSVRQLANVFTKGLPSVFFFDFTDSLSIIVGNVETPRECERNQVHNG
jgi:hypothetical protein